MEADILGVRIVFLALVFAAILVSCGDAAEGS